MKVLFLLISFGCGVLLGWLLRQLTACILRNRSGNAAPTERQAWRLLWMISSGIAVTSAYALQGVSVLAWEWVFVFSVCAVISVVDSRLRVIPDALILTLLAGGIAFYFLGDRSVGLLSRVLGLTAGFVLFLLPCLFGSAVGGGDIKLAATIGFFVGLSGVLVAFVIMAAALLIRLVQLKFTKQGGLRTQVAMGPYLAIGMATITVFRLIG